MSSTASVEKGASDNHRPLEQRPGYRFYFLDGLRGFAACWVVLYHAKEGGHIARLMEVLPGFLVASVFRAGQFGVPIFFAISGFVIAHSLRQVRVDSAFLKNFSLQRVVRLSPPYYASIVFALLMSAIAAVFTGEVFDLPSVGDLAAHVFYLQDMLGVMPITSVYWTLCLEIQFYLVFCCLLWLSQRLAQTFERDGPQVVKGAQIKAVIFSVVAAVSYLWPLGVFDITVAFGVFIQYWYSFSLGIFAYWAWKGERLFSVLFYAQLALLLPALLSVPSQWPSQAGIASLVASALIFVVAMSNQIYRLLSWRWIQFLGLISYSLYLTHNSVWGATAFVGKKILGDGLLSEVAVFAICFGICLAIATMAYYWIEKPSIKAYRRMKTRRA